MNQQKQNSNSQDGFSEFFGEVVKSLLILTWHGSRELLKGILSAPLKWGGLIAALFFSVKYLALNAYHLKFLNWLWPSVFSGKILNWFYDIPAGYHYWGIFLFILWITALVKGGRFLRDQKKTESNFRAMGLKNGLSETPKIVSKNIIDEFDMRVVIDSNGIPLEHFENKKSSLEGMFGKPIKSIEQGHEPKFIKIHLSSRRLPRWNHFKTLKEKSILCSNEFYVGESLEGVMTSDISKLPHMLIAGCTGGGKSVFFKQTLAGLLENSDHLQMCLIDLKKGLEFTNFKSAPNVSIAKDYEEAVILLERVKKEMGSRFQLLEKKGFKSIDPQRDKKDRIIVAVDEAGELYATPSKYDNNYELIEKAKTLTNSIARLGRAAGIHLILATQKVSKETINTTIQENISARMCFKMNTLQGSLQVLGCKDAMELPSIPGRGIWQFGTQQSMVQVPYIQEREIKQICENLKSQFEDGEKTLNQPKLLLDDIENTSKPFAEFRKNLVDIDV